MSGNPAVTRDPALQSLLEHILDDQRSCWRRGEGVPVEEFLARDPALRGDVEAMLDLIYHEYCVRRELGENLDPNEFTSRFPELAQPLLIQFGLDAGITMACEPPASVNLKGSAQESQPTRLGDYEILERLGQGNMGVVYKARDLKLGRTVAIKMMIAGSYATAEQRERFRSEALAAARLRHPNIIGIDVVGEHEDRPFLALEYAAGGSLADQLVNKPVGAREAAELMETLSRAVHAAHQAGVVHRDLKPSNILLTADGVLKVSDFGLAKLLDFDSGRTLSGQIMGTPSYMAPEQAEGHSRKAGPAADIYALGAILYQGLVGRPPFLGESAMETLRMVVATEPVSPRSLRPKVPRDLETICLKCLAKEPARRYASGQLLAEDLRRFLDGRPIEARPVGPAGRLWRWARRNPWVAGLSATVALSLVLGTIVSTVQMIRAIRAEAATRDQRDRAEAESKISRAVRDFMKNDILAQASTYHQLGLFRNPDRDLKVSTAVDRAAEKISEQFADQPLVEAEIRQTLGETYVQLGLYPQAAQHLQRALELRRKLLGNDDLNTLLSMKLLGVVYLEDGKFAEAEPLLVGAMEGIRKQPNIDRSELADAQVLVAQLKIGQEKYSEAEQLLTEARDFYLARRGPNDIKTLDAGNKLGALYAETRKSEQARKILEDVLSRSERELGADNVFSQSVRYGLYDAYEQLGLFQEAEQQLERAIDVQTKLLGRTHPETLASLAKLGMFYAARKQTDKAVPLLEQAHAGARTALDRNHMILVAALAGLAPVYQQKGDWTRLAAVATEAAQILRIRGGPDDGLAAVGFQIAGMSQLMLGDYEQAAKNYGECLIFHIRNHPTDPDRYIKELLLAMSMLGQKKFTEARAHFLIGYEGLRPDRDHASVADDASLGWLIGQVLQLRGADGRRLVDTTTLGRLVKDPALQMIALDLIFPANPFSDR